MNARVDLASMPRIRLIALAQLDRAAIDDIRLALNQSQPLGNARFYSRIEQITRLRHKAKPRGRPRVNVE